MALENIFIQLRSCAQPFDCKMCFLSQDVKPLVNDRAEVAKRCNDTCRLILHIAHDVHSDDFKILLLYGALIFIDPTNSVTYRSEI